MIINTSTKQELILWNQIQYLGLPFISALWLTVALLYTKTIYTLSRRMAVALLGVPIITFFLRLTNPWHHLFYKNYELKQHLGQNILYLERGCWYYVFIVFTILYLILTIIVYYLGYRRKQAGYTKPQFMIFFFASLFPLIGVMLVLITYQKWMVDIAALTMPISVFIIGYGILKYDFLEIKTLARETIFENSVDGMLILESGLRLIDYNKAAKRFFKTLNISLDNYPMEQLLNREPHLLKIMKSESTKEFCVMIHGEKRFFEISTLPLDVAHGKKAKMLKSIRDITEKKKIQEILTNLATIDSLSGLYNRAEFMRRAQREFRLAEKGGKKLSLLMIDIDHYKSINDTLGHAAGDEVIRVMGEILRTILRKTDIAGRLGGDEFIALLKNASLTEAIEIAEKIRETVSSTKAVYEKQEFAFAVSIGVVEIFDDHSDFETALKRADDALYKAKSEGRNCVSILESHEV